MNIQQLQALGLESKWPRLARLQGEIAGLEKRNREAEGQVQQLQAELVPARNRDLDAEARAVRSGRKSPEPTHEPDIQRKLERATRDRDVMQRALEAARTDYGAFLSKHRSELFADVAEARAEIAASVSEAAREALRGFGKWSDMHYTLKSLQPPVEPADSTAPAQNISVVLGVGTARSSGPDRGEIEQALRYLVSLDPGPAQGDENAA